MVFRRDVLLGAAAVMFLGAISAHAGGTVAYSDTVFENALASGAPVLVAIHASWCPTCAAQTPIIEGLLSDRFKEMKEIRVDFDTQKDVVRKLGANMQSTLIVFRNGQEVGRSVGDTDPASIEALLAKAH